MASNINIFEIEKNAVIIHYPNLFNKPSFAGQRPIGCCVRFLGYFIGAGHGLRGFSVYGNGIHREFPSLFEAKSFIINRVYKNTCIYDEV